MHAAAVTAVTIAVVAQRWVIIPPLPPSPLPRQPPAGPSPVWLMARRTLGARRVIGRVTSGGVAARLLRPAARPSRAVERRAPLRACSEWRVHVVRLERVHESLAPSRRQMSGVAAEARGADSLARVARCRGGARDERHVACLHPPAEALVDRCFEAAEHPAQVHVQRRGGEVDRERCAARRGAAQRVEA